MDKLVEEDPCKDAAAVGDNHQAWAWACRAYPVGKVVAVLGASTSASAAPSSSAFRALLLAFSAWLIVAGTASIPASSSS